MRVKSILILGGAVIAYIILGALLFQFIENAHFTNPIRKSRFVSSHKAAKWSEQDSEILRKLIAAVIKAAREETGVPLEAINITVTANPTNNSEFTIEAHISDRLPHKWSNIYNAIFYTETLLATAGYGKVITKSMAGRLCSCLYVVIGIPMFGVWVCSVGEKMVDGARKLRRHWDVSPRWHQHFLIAQALCVFFAGMVIFVLLPSILFAHMENWSYIGGFYFSIISLTTIALGDMAAGIQDDAPKWYRFFVFIWFIFGVCWLGTIISFILEIVAARALKAVRTVASFGTRLNELADRNIPVIRRALSRSLSVNQAAGPSSPGEARAVKRSHSVSEALPEVQRAVFAIGGVSVAPSAASSSSTLHTVQTELSSTC